MDLLKKADKTFRVVLRTDHKINGSTLREPEFNIKHNYQEQYKFYNRCIILNLGGSRRIQNTRAECENDLSVLLTNLTCDQNCAI